MKSVTTLIALLTIPALWTTGCGSAGTTGQGTDGGTAADAPAAAQDDGATAGGDGASASGAIGDRDDLDVLAQVLRVAHVDA